MLMTTALHPYKKGVAVISFNGEPYKEFSVAIFGKNPSFPTSDSLEEFEQAFREMEFKFAYIYCIRRLAAMTYFSLHLKDKLIEKAIDPSTAEEVIQKCLKEGYLNDDEWIASFIKSQLRKKNGPAAIAAKLQSKGVGSHQFKPILDNLAPEETQMEQIQTLLDTKYRNSDVNDFQAKQKLIGALSRKGFKISIINRVLEGEYL